MSQWKEIEGAGVPTLDQSHLQGVEEAGNGHPEIVTYHQDALDASPIALAQGLYQRGTLIVWSRMQPLLELIENDQDLLALVLQLIRADGRNQVAQAPCGRHARELLAQGIEQVLFGLSPARFDVDRRHAIGEQRKQSRFHEG